MHADLSVIIPFFNDHQTIIRAIDSIKNQTLHPKEIIIIDDHSFSPLKVEKIKKILEETKIKLILSRNTKNLGASQARNFGVNKARSKYICFLDADDSWHSEKIKIQYSLMINHGIVFSFHNYVNISKTKTKNSKQKIKKINFYRFSLGNFICTPTVMCKKKSFVLFDENHSRMEDYKCWIENSLINNIYFIDANLAYGYKKQIGESGLSGSIQLMHSSCLSVIESLKKEKKISLIFYLTAKLIENIKYPIRIIKNIV